MHERCIAFSAPAHPPLKAWDGTIPRISSAQEFNNLLRRPLGAKHSQESDIIERGWQRLGTRERATVYHVHLRLAPPALLYGQRIQPTR
jgi:hypothetical protein